MEPSHHGMLHVQHIEFEGAGPYLICLYRDIYIIVLIMPFCVKSQEDILQQGECGRTSKRV